MGRLAQGLQGECKFVFRGRKDSAPQAGQEGQGSSRYASRRYFFATSSMFPKAGGAPGTGRLLHMTTTPTNIRERPMLP
jgi:hypothetical protein